MEHTIVSLKKIQYLRNFKGDRQQFWSLFLDIMVTVSQADSGVIVVLDNAKEWRTIAYYPKAATLNKYGNLILDHVDRLNELIKTNVNAIIQEQQYTLLSVPVIFDLPGAECLSILCVKKISEKEAEDRLNALGALKDLSAHYQIKNAISNTLEYKKRISEILEFLSLVKEKKNFLSAAMTFCNEISSRFECNRASLGWLKNGYIRVVALSHTDNFEKKMDLVKSLETTMEEALDQDRDIYFPYENYEDRVVTREHQLYAKANDVEYISTIVLRYDDEIIGICCLERNNKPFGKEEIQSLRIMSDQAAPALKHLKYYDRWFGAILADKARNLISKVFGFEYTWVKLFTMITILFLIFSIFAPLKYRIDSKAILRTDKIHYITAPFQGYIDRVNVKEGDMVSAGQELLRMDMEELRLKEADLLAEIRKYKSEMQNAHALEELAQMSISQAKIEQAEAQLNIIRFKLNQSVIKAELGNAVIIEGDLEKKEGMAVDEGSQLFKIAGIENIYAEIEVDESEIQNIDSSLFGEIALKSRPERKFPVKIVLLHPSARVSTENSNVFILRAELVDSKPAWFRPGMTGIAKVNGGKHCLFWIVSHQVIDFLQMRLWW